MKNIKHHDSTIVRLHFVSTVKKMYYLHDLQWHFYKVMHAKEMGGVDSIHRSGHGCL